MTNAWRDYVEIESLRRSMAAVRREVESVKRLLAERKAGYNPSQPRVSAGNPDGGQWTRIGGDPAPHYADAGNFVDPPVMSDANPEALIPGAQYAQASIDYSRALTGISTVDETTKSLSGILARTMETLDFIPEWTPQVYGTAVHVAFGTAVRFGGLPGIGATDVEHSFVGGKSTDYGQPGSIRTDVVLRDAVGEITAIYDVKTGGAKLSKARVEELREKTGVSASVPIIELHVIRGGTLKGRISGRRIIGHVIAQLWNGN